LIYGRDLPEKYLPPAVVEKAFRDREREIREAVESFRK
jgi:hypothetical protein